MYAGFYCQLHTSAVTKVQEMAYKCLSNIWSNTARNIFRICDELSLKVITVTLEAVRLAWQSRASLPDDLWKIKTLRALLDEWLEEKANEAEEEEHGITVFNFINMICET